MKASLLGVFGVSLVLAAAQCPHPFGPDQSVILHVSRIAAPSSIAANQRLTATLTVTTGGCLSFRHFEIDRTSTQVRITAWGRDAAKGRSDVSCPQDVRHEDHVVSIDPPFAGTVTLIAVNPAPSPPLSATVQVQ